MPRWNAWRMKRATGGWGLLLYLRQEGRGIGLINKLRAYELQDQGFDTVDANERLGLPSEARDFPVAARMLDLLGVSAVRLLTNNPAKVAALEARGGDSGRARGAPAARQPAQCALSGHEARPDGAFAGVRPINRDCPYFIACQISPGTVPHFLGDCPLPL